jgi:hypothetical protein
LSTPEAVKLASVLPTPDPDTATITGWVVTTSNQPAAGIVVFLERTAESHAVPAIIYAPPNSQPSTTSDSDGKFVISDVPDGEYVVVVYSPPASIQLATLPKSGQTQFITAYRGAVIDVGTIRLTQ